MEETRKCGSLLLIWRIRIGRLAGIGSCFDKFLLNLIRYLMKFKLFLQICINNIGKHPIITNESK